MKEYIKQQPVQLQVGLGQTKAASTCHRAAEVAFQRHPACVYPLLFNLVGQMLDIAVKTLI